MHFAYELSYNAQSHHAGIENNIQNILICLIIKIFMIENRNTILCFPNGFHNGFHNTTVYWGKRVPVW